MVNEMNKLIERARIALRAPCQVVQTTNIHAKAPEGMAKKENHQVTEIAERTNREGNLTETTSDWINVRSFCNEANWTSGLSRSRARASRC
jgi:hypothetical protein